MRNNSNAITSIYVDLWIADSIYQISSTNSVIKVVKTQLQWELLPNLIGKYSNKSIFDIWYFNNKSKWLMDNNFLRDSVHFICFKARISIQWVHYEIIYIEISIAFSENPNIFFIIRDEVIKFSEYG